MTIVLSDASSPGEGEHKIAAIIREQRQQPGYDPDTTHLIYGLDADLVMIGLATHERRCYILRDWVPLGRQRFLEVCDVCGQEGHTARACPVLSAARAFQSASQRAAELKALRDAVPHKPLLLLSLPTFREYLLHALRPAALGWPATPEAREAHAAETQRAAEEAEAAKLARSAAADDAEDDADSSVAGDGSVAGEGSVAGDDAWWDSERLVDDFVFITFLVGNDFLPPLPLLSIATGGLDLSLDLYRRHRRGLGGYLLSDNGQRIEAGPFGRLLALVAAEETRAIKGKLGKQQEREQKAGGAKVKRQKKGRKVEAEKAEKAEKAEEAEKAEKTEKGEAELEAELEGKVPVAAAAGMTTACAPAAVADLSLLSDEDKAAALAAAESPAAWRALEDEMRFGPTRITQEGFHAGLCADYLQALRWCAHYYYQGCADWRFFFPYHYAPFASDAARQISGWQPESWSDASPLPPLTQLISVLPPLSAHLLPPPYASLVTDEASPACHLFPTKVELDFRGKKHEWQAVVLLPFIPIDELCAAVAPLPLDEAEQARNATLEPLVFAGARSELARATVGRAGALVEVEWTAGALGGRVRPWSREEITQRYVADVAEAEAAAAAEEEAARAAAEEAAGDEFDRLWAEAEAAKEAERQRARTTDGRAFFMSEEEAAAGALPSEVHLMVMGGEEELGVLPRGGRVRLIGMDGEEVEDDEEDDEEEGEEEGDVEEGEEEEGDDDEAKAEKTEAAEEPELDTVSMEGIWVAAYAAPDPPAVHSCEVLRGGAPLAAALTLGDLAAARNTKSAAMAAGCVEHAAEEASGGASRSGGGNGGGGGGGGSGGGRSGGAGGGGKKRKSKGSGSGISNSGGGGPAGDARGSKAGKAPEQHPDSGCGGLFGGGGAFGFTFG